MLLGCLSLLLHTPHGRDDEADEDGAQDGDDHEDAPPWDAAHPVLRLQERTGPVLQVDPGDGAPARVYPLLELLVPYLK